MKNFLTKIINDLPNQIEGLNLEFKESSNNLTKDFWPTYSAFANTCGGYIILGVAENPTRIIGVNDPNKIKQEIFNIANNKEKTNFNIISDDNIEIHLVDGKSIISVFIPELQMHKKPLYLNGNIKKSYIRKNEGDYLATDDDIRRFIRNSHDDNDSELLDNYSIEDLDNTSVLEFKNILNNRNPSKNYLSLDNFSFLKEMGVFQIDRNDNTRNWKLTLAGLLFLGKLNSIIQKIPHFHLEYLNKRDTNTRWKDRISSGDDNYSDLNLFQYYKIVLEKLKLSINEPFILDERCVRKSYIELDVALREALANMIIHADYFDPETSIKVEVEDFFYTFLNPGTLKVTPEQFFTGGKSSPRNNILMSYFRRIGVCERAGSGGKEIVSVILKNNFREPQLETNDRKTSLKIWVAALEDSYPELSTSSRNILFYIQKNREVQFKELKAKFQDLSAYSIRKALSDLEFNKYIYTYGQGRSTKYAWNLTLLDKVSIVDNLKKHVLFE